MTTLTKIIGTVLFLAAPAIALADFDRDNDHGNRWGHTYHYDRYYSSPRAGGWGNGAIDRGIRNGELSRDEVRELRNDQREIRRDEAEARSDGHVSRGEREELRDDYRDYQKDLNHELHDGEHRY